MSVVRVIDIMAQSEDSWEAAARDAVAEASKMYPGILSLRVNRLEAVVEEDEITFFRVKLKLAHVLDTEALEEIDDMDEEDMDEEDDLDDEDEDDLGEEEQGELDEELDEESEVQTAEQNFGEDGDEEELDGNDEARWDEDNELSDEGEEEGFGEGEEEEEQKSAGQRRGRAGDGRRASAPPKGPKRTAPRAEPEVARRGTQGQSRSADFGASGERKMKSARRRSPEPARG